MIKNKVLKRKLIMQSFAPLFLILFIKYFEVDMLGLPQKLIQRLIIHDWYVVTDVLHHPLFVTWILELYCIIWLIYTVISSRDFQDIQNANFISQGEALKDIEKISDSGVTFFMTYVLPMAMDDLNTGKGMIVFVILMGMLSALMWKTNLYYQNPILTILGYDVFSFRFETTELREFKDKECIGITRGAIQTGKNIKRQYISDNVFLIYEDMR